MSITNLPARLRRVVQQMDWTQADLAKAAGASKQTVSSWLSDGHQRIDAKFAFGIQDASGFSARWILLGQGPERFPSHEKLLEMSRNLSAIGELLDALRSR